MNENTHNKNGIFVSALVMRYTWNRQTRSTTIQNILKEKQKRRKESSVIRNSSYRNTVRRLVMNPNLLCIRRHHECCLFSTYDESSYSEKDHDNENDSKYYTTDNTQYESTNNNDLILDKKKLRQLRLLQSLQQTSTLMLPLDERYISNDFNSDTIIEDSTTITKSSTSSSFSSDEGLSRFHRRLLISTSNRQRFVTGTYPLFVSVRDSPTRHWLRKKNMGFRGQELRRRRAFFLDDGTGEGLLQLQQLQREIEEAQGMATCQLYVNDTLVERSLASFERYGWLEDEKKEDRIELKDHKVYSSSTDESKECLSLELVAEINVRKPGYLNILPKYLNAKGRDLDHFSSHGSYNDDTTNRKFTSWFTKLQQKQQAQHNDNPDYQNDDMLWISDFSLTKKGGITSVDTQGGMIRPVGKINGIWKEIGKAMNYKNEDKDEVGISFEWPNEVGAVPVQRFMPSMLNNDGDENETTIVPETLLKESSKNNDTIENNFSNLYEPIKYHENALLVTDGFLVPGLGNGGLYVVQNLGQDNIEHKVCLTGGDDTKNNDSFHKNDNTLKSSSFLPEENTEWFYHRAVWVDLTGDGRKSILSARAKRPSILNTKNGETTSNRNPSSTTTTTTTTQNQTFEYDSTTRGDTGQLIWLECPKPHRFDEETGTPLDIDDTVFNPFSARHTPWKLRVLDEGPDVMFSIADLDPSDKTIEVMAAQFFGKRVSLHSIEIGNKNNNFTPRVIFRRIIDDSCGASFSSVLARLKEEPLNTEHTNKVVIDSGSTVETLKLGDQFSHLLVTNHECPSSSSDAIDREVANKKQDKNDETIQNISHQIESKNDKDILASQYQETDGGSLFSYQVPKNWRTDPWRRNVIATGFRVRGQLGNMINPGAPGFCYTFHPKKIKDTERSFTRPYIAISGDCGEAAYILSPVQDKNQNENNFEAGPCCVQVNGCNSVTKSKNQNKKHGQHYDHSTKYSLMCEIECGATVGSLAIGYDNFCNAPGQREDYAKIYIPCFEKDKVLVFAFGNGEE